MSAVNRPEKPLCLNKEKCRERYLLKHCPVTSPAERAAILKGFYAQQSKEGRLNVLSATPDAVQSLQGTGRYIGKLADTVDVIINGDYGADHCALSKEHLQKCADAGIFIQVLPLAPPIQMQLATADRTDS